MRVILSIDALHQPLTGIGWYALELAQGLAALPAIESLVFTDGRRFPLALPEFVRDPGVAQVSTRARVRMRHKLIKRLAPVAEALLVRRCGAKLRRLEDHVCHAPNYVIPRRDPRALNTATIHDLSIVRYPELHPAARVRYMSKRIPLSIAHCARLIVSSFAVAEEVSETFAVHKDRIDVVPLGVRSVFCESVDAALDAPLLSSVGVERGGYLLFVNGADPRKDLAGALKAFRCYQSQQPSALQLVVTVPPYALPDLKATLSAEQNVILLPYPDDQQLAALYRGTAGLLFPSVYEGFGLPVVEVLAAGRPVLVSQAETLLEFAHLPGVVSVDTKDVQAFCAGIDELCGSETSAAAASGAAAIATQFSWQRCVANTAATYASLL